MSPGRSENHWEEIGSGPEWARGDCREKPHVFKILNELVQQLGSEALEGEK